MVNSKQLKVALGFIILLALVLLNIKKYWVEGDVKQANIRQYNEVSELIIPPALTDNSNSSFSRDIFVRLDVSENQSTDVADDNVPEESAQTRDIAKEKVAEIGTYKDVSLLGVSMRAEAAMALIGYEGRSYYVAVGDVVGGRYFIESIDESGVYVSTK